MEKQQLNKMRSGTFRKKHEIHINNTNLNDEHFKHRDNRITTTKYNIATFLPKALLFQFFRLANCYFLIIAIIQCIPSISPLTPVTAIAPLAFVLCISMIREGFEDYARHKYDKVQNAEPVKVFRNGFIDSTSDTLKVGEIIVVEQNKVFPADLLLLDSDMQDGIAQIETATLDGERSLKKKIASKKSSGFFKNGGTWKDKFEAEGNFSCEPPNSNLYEMNGVMILTLNDLMNDKRKLDVPVDAKQLLLKGAVLRNTKWVIGFVLFTGKNTKLILNSLKQRMKFSRVETLMSRLLIFILLIQMVLCIISAASQNRAYWNNLINHTYLPPPLDNNPAMDSLINYFTYTLLLNTMIPISLIITLEIVKFVQGIFTRFDVELYSKVRQKFAMAGSISLNEELGQVNYIFSDKTGTLTCNKMNFKYCVVGDVCYEYNKDYVQDAKGKVVTEEEERIKAEMNIKTIGPNYMKGYLKKNSAAINRTKYKNYTIKSEHNENVHIKMQDESVLINEFWKALAICHDCQVAENNNKLEYSGASPDDIELVKTASDQGYQWVKGDSDYSRRVKIGNEVKEYSIKTHIEFSSDRKRMSLIVEDGPYTKLYIKGADNIIKTRLGPESRKDFEQAASYYVDHFSTQGYRTLFVGMKLLDKKYFEDWSNRLQNAEKSENKHENVKRLYEEIEQGIHLIGATIVEDKLQDEVPNTIRDFRIAGVKIWMLTGDKMDTAYNIGLSCNLINESENIFKICGEKGDKVEAFFEDFFMNYNENSKIFKPYSILLDAIALSSVLASNDNIQTFLTIASESASVICCRVTPLQKSDVVRIMKNFNKDAVTLSIGDGGNDVSMITEAHIGIGVYGEEGMQAVQASDYAIGEFKMLRRLLMFHGRTNNIRISEMILYFFFKNFIFTIVHFLFAFYNNFSGQTVFDDWFISLYNMIFTALPLGVRALSDFDVIPEDGIIVDRMMPILYKENRDTPIFTKMNFGINILRGVVFALITFFTVVSSVSESAINSDGTTGDIWFMSANIFTAIIFIVSFRLILLSRHMIWLFPIIMFITSWVAFLAFAMFVHNSMGYKSFAAIIVSFTSTKFYLNFFLSLILTSMIDKATYAYDILFTDKYSSGLILNRYKNGTVENVEDLPDKIKLDYKKYFDPKRIKGMESDLINVQKIKKPPVPVNHEESISNSLTKHHANSNRDVSINTKLSKEFKEMDTNKYNKKMSLKLEEKVKDFVYKPVDIDDNSNLNDISKYSNNPMMKSNDTHLISYEEEKTGPIITQLEK